MNAKEKPWKGRTKFLILKVKLDRNREAQKNPRPQIPSFPFPSPQIPNLTTFKMKRAMKRMPRKKRKRSKKVKKMEALKQAIRMPSLERPIIHLRKRTTSAANSEKLS